MTEIVLMECIELQAQSLADNTETGCEAIFKNDKVDDLKKMYDIFIRVRGSTDHIVRKFTEFIMTEGKCIISNEDLVGGKDKKDEKGKIIKNNGDPYNFTMALLELKYRCDGFIDQSFSNDMLL